ncbi:hypothetical protein DFJ74DRAFT_712866 [Hyaloraphidium curvatum]|nr:hypothetical protein DFJ74DRAFT_712866 [Hyaloraphidium curvatum]
MSNPLLEALQQRFADLFTDPAAPDPGSAPPLPDPPRVASLRTKHTALRPDASRWPRIPADFAAALERWSDPSKKRESGTMLRLENWVTQNGYRTVERAGWSQLGFAVLTGNLPAVRDILSAVERAEGEEALREMQWSPQYKVKGEDYAGVVRFWVPSMWYTAFHHSLMNQPLYATADLLLSLGADVNAPTVSGCNISMAAVNARDQATLKYLLERGVDIDQEVDSMLGRKMTPRLYANKMGLSTTVAKADRKAAKEAVRKEGGMVCAKCGKGESGAQLSRCSRCHAVFYCGRAYQNWPAHKKACQARSAELARTVTVTVGGGPPSGAVSTMLNKPAGAPRAVGFKGEVPTPPAYGERFVVKAQIMLDPTIGSMKVAEPDPNEAIMVYDDKRSYATQIFGRGQEAEWREIWDKVHRDGINSAKAYFYATVDRAAPEKLTLVIGELARPQKW